MFRWLIAVVVLACAGCPPTLAGTCTKNSDCKAQELCFGHPDGTATCAVPPRGEGEGEGAEGEGEGAEGEGEGEGAEGEGEGAQGEGGGGGGEREGGGGQGGGGGEGEGAASLTLSRSVLTSGAAVVRGNNFTCAGAVEISA